MRASHFACSLAAACLALQGCGGTAFMLPPVTQNEALLAAHEVQASADLPVFDRTGSYYRDAIARIETRLTRDVVPLCTRAETPECHFTFRYVGDGEVNAFTDEDGQIYLHKGLLDYLETDEEIAAVMAHEMGHQIADHVEETRESAIVGALIGGLLLGVGAAALGADQNTANYAANEGMTYGGRIGVLSFSKEQEREADLLGVYVLARAGYDLERAGGTFEVLAKLGDKTTASWNDTHPAGPERIVAYRKTVAEVEQSADKLPPLAEP